MYKTYQRNKVLVHAQAIHFGSLSYVLWLKKLLRIYGYNFTFGIEQKISVYKSIRLFPWDLILQFYVTIFPKAIRGKSHILMIIVYIGNGYEIFGIIENFYDYCSNNLLNENICGFKLFIQNDPYFQVVFVLGNINSFDRYNYDSPKYQEFTSEFEYYDNIPINDPKEIENERIVII
ncbi:7567_t:CDS:2 [Funneliformis geosporum]|uniref:7567_t:CDS:1 n=1 Tax=Funneliformis geosporum TaxID=1117311 RepID=A0A9W4WQ21_9GLOM|nr:7567_t:CDS:2 [Funneliformis geosporum]